MDNSDSEDTDERHKEELEQLQKNADKLTQLNINLKKVQKLGENQTNDFLAYFQLELEKKDKIIDEMNATILRLEVERDSRIREVEENSQKQIDETVERYELKKSKIVEQIKLIDDQIVAHEEYRTMKELTEIEYNNLVSEVKKQEIINKNDAETLERNHIEELSKLQKATTNKILSLLDNIKYEAEKGLESDSLKIIEDNNKMNIEMNYLLTQSIELQKICKKFEELHDKYNRELSIYKEKETLYNNIHLNINNEYKELTNVITVLESEYKDLVIMRQKEINTIQHDYVQSLSDLVKESKSLQNLLKVKNTELKTIRELATIILEQRLEVEQFFSDSISYIQKQIKSNRDLELASKIDEFNRQLKDAFNGKSRFPEIKTKSQIIQDVKLNRTHTNISQNEKVDIDELTWDEKEKVFKLLYAKINGLGSRTGMNIL